MKPTSLPLACALAACVSVPSHAADADDTGHAMHGHMDDDPLRAFVLAERLEWQSDGSQDRGAWDVSGYIGKDAGRLWLRAEGARSGGSTAENQVEALWGRPLSRWWDVLAGVRHDFGPGPSRSWAALGIQGVAPYELEVEITAYVSDRGTVALTTEIDYEVLLTQRWILQPRFEATWLSRADVAREQEAGVSTGAVGLRLRYEIRRELAPYIGAEWTRHGEGRDGLAFVAGVRAWL